MKGIKDRINISNEELDKDIINLNMSEIDIVPPNTIDEIEFYSEEMKQWLKKRTKEV